jgi:hypothetical protein
MSVSLQKPAGRILGQERMDYPASLTFFGNGMTSAVVGAYRLMYLIWFTVSVSG